MSANCTEMRLYIDIARSLKIYGQHVSFIYVMHITANGQSCVPCCSDITIIVFCCM